MNGSLVPGGMSGESSDEGEEEAVASSSVLVSENPVTADARRLLRQFSSKASVSYRDFKRTWTLLKFSFIYCAGADPPRRQEIVTCLTVEALRCIIKGHLPHHERLGGLYLLYTVYCTQPTDPKTPIRVSEEGWAALQQLQQVIRENKYVEADYILHYLRTHQAFNLTYTLQPMCMGPSSGDHATRTLQQMFLTSSHSLNPHFLSSLSQEIEEAMTEYHSAKEERKVFFPQHLLNPQQLTNQLSKIVADYDASVNTKLARFRES